MAKNFVKVLSISLVFVLLSVISCHLYAAPASLGKQMVVDSNGRDPDIAIDSEGSLHIAFVRGASTYNRKVIAPYTDKKNIGKLHFVGSGVNPQIAVDSSNAPHVVYGKARYAYWNGKGFTEAGQAFNAWRKNLIAIDSKDQVYIVGDIDKDRVSRKREVAVRVYKNGKAISNKHKIGDDNPGGMDFDENDRLFITWRAGLYTYARTYKFTDHPTSNNSDLHVTENKYRFPNASGDFSWCSFNPLDKSVHVVYSGAHSSGVFSSVRRNGKWKNLSQAARGYGNRIDADNLNPVSATDKKGYTYITFVGGRNTDALYLVYNNKDTLETVARKSVFTLATTNVGGKMTNPNVASHPEMSGVFVAWGEKEVRVTTIGDISFPTKGTNVSSVVNKILLDESTEKP